MQEIENLPFWWAQGHSSLGGGVSSCSTLEALSGSGDDEFEDESFLLRHLFLFFFFLIGFSGSSIGFDFFILILFGCFFFSCFSSKRGCPEAKANISFLPAKWNWICPEATYIQAFVVLRKGRPRIKGVSSALPMSKIIKSIGTSALLTLTDKSVATPSK